MDQIKIRVPHKKLVEICRRKHIPKLAFFGSVLRDDFGPGKIPGFAFFGMQEELSEILGHKVDLNTPGFLRKYFREQVIREARVEYVQTRS
jgi:predicted nucleotidyltransferase